MVNQLLLFPEPGMYGGQPKKQKFSEFLKNYIKNLGRENVVKVRVKANEGDEDLYKKVHNHIKRYSSNYSVEDIMSEIASNDLVAELFAADPSRQKVGVKSITKFLSLNGFEFEKGDLDFLGYFGKKKEHYISVKNPDVVMIPFIVSGEGGGQTKKIGEHIPNLAKFCANQYSEYRFKFVLEGERYSRMGEAERVSLRNNHDYPNVEYLSADNYNE